MAYIRRLLREFTHVIGTDIYMPAGYENLQQQQVVDQFVQLNRALVKIQSELTGIREALGHLVSANPEAKRAREEDFLRRRGQ